MIAGLGKPTTGTLLLSERPIEEPGPDRGVVFQHHGLLPWMSVYENVFVAVDSVYGARVARAEKSARVERVLRMVGLWDHRDKKPGQMSGGMKQRTSVARAFALEPEMLLLDEPFGALDALTKATMHDELIALWSSDRDSKTVVMVTHDIDEAIFLSDRVVVMTNGPAATVREIVQIPVARPRSKRAMIYMPEYAEVKDHLLRLLTHDLRRPPRVEPEEHHGDHDGRVVMTPYLAR
jgi:ABC-type nitrate/sulfonate/bicarbonate transport system ATPase subunit